MTNEQYLEKTNILKKWAHAYYVEDNPVATDEEYDKLYHEVLDYETTHPGQVAEDSPTKRVGGVVRDEFSKAKHIKRMWSMEDVFDRDRIVGEGDFDVVIIVFLFAVADEGVEVLDDVSGECVGLTGFPVTVVAGITKVESLVLFNFCFEDNFGGGGLPTGAWLSIHNIFLL